MTRTTLSTGWRDVYRALSCPTSIEGTRPAQRGEVA